MCLLEPCSSSVLSIAMRLSFSTLTQASRADGSVARMRSVVTRSASFSSPAPSTVSSATARIGLDAICAATSDFGSRLHHPG